MLKLLSAKLTAATTKLTTALLISEISNIFDQNGQFVDENKYYIRGLLA